MNSDAWTAAVSPTLNASSRARDEPTGTTAPSSSSCGSATLAPIETKKPSGRRKSGLKKAALAAANAAGSKPVALATPPTQGGREEYGGDCGSGADVCYTAPASPGSPTGAAAVVHEIPAVCTVASAAAEGSRPAAGDGAADDVLPGVGIEVAVVAAPAPREGAEAEHDSGVGSVMGGEEDALSDSLRLEPDFELEAASVEGLKADLGLPTAQDEGDEDGSAAEVLGSGKRGGIGGMGDDDDIVTDDRVDDLGFEMIDRAEALAATTGTGDAARASGSAGSWGGKVRKGWSWSWTRS